MITLSTGIGGGVVLSPDAVLGDARGPLVMIGGNVARAGDLLLKPARNVAIKSLFDDVEIGLAEPIDDAGMLGAALALKWGQ